MIPQKVVKFLVASGGSVVRREKYYFPIPTSATCCNSTFSSYGKRGYHCSRPMQFNQLSVLQFLKISKSLVNFPKPLAVQRRFLWGWLNSVFNRVDDSRIKEVGPDRACAEWLLRCGAGVKWDKGSDELLRDYNSLPAGNYRGLKIVEIDATDSAVMHIGFPHLRGLMHVKKAIFHRCGYLEDEAVQRIGFLKDCLEELQISSNGNITDGGILTLVQLKNLKKLTLYDFLEVRDRKHCVSVLQQSLPNCKIYFPFAREKDRDPETRGAEKG